MMIEAPPSGSDLKVPDHNIALLLHIEVHAIIKRQIKNIVRKHATSHGKYSLSIDRKLKAFEFWRKSEQLFLRSGEEVVCHLYIFRVLLQSLVELVLLREEATRYCW